MNVLIVLIVCGFFASTEPKQDKTADYTLKGPFEVQKIEFEWQDSNRKRTIPVLIYMPKDIGIFPVIIFSHGLGGSREGYAYLGNHWASRGYVSVHLQHIGSDNSVWQGKKPADMRSNMNAAASAKNAIDRGLDVRFALDTLEKLNQDDTLFKGKLDMQRVGMAGHSFGGQTTLTAIGLLGYNGKSIGDDRIKAAIAMSAPAIKNAYYQKKAYKNIHVPCMHMTGTLDNSPIGDTRPEDRRIPYDNIEADNQYFLNFNGADHMVFSGRSGVRGDRSNDDLFHRYILNASAAFWDAYLKDDAQAKTWLQKGGFEKYLGDNGVLEKKNSTSKNSARQPQATYELSK